MTIHNKKIKRIFNLFIIALCLCLSIIALRAGSIKIYKLIKNTSEDKKITPDKNNEVDSENQTITNRKITKIIFQKNDNIYLYDDINQQIKSIGDNSKLKDLLRLSPDKTKIAFRYYNQGKAIYPPHIIIYDIKTQVITDVVIGDKDVQQVIDLKWIDDVNILVTGHINPSSSGYGVYNIESKLQLISCVGTIRDITINNKNILYSNTPHIFPTPRANLYLNGNKIFESSKDKEKIYDAVISKDGKMIAFRSSVENQLNSEEGVSAYLNIAEINSDNKSISNLKNIIISSDTTGDMKFDDKNNISIVGSEFIYKLKNDKLIKMENSNPKKEEISPQQLKKFKEVLAKQFPEEVILDGTLLEDIDLYDMEAF